MRLNIPPRAAIAMAALFLRIGDCRRSRAHHLQPELCRGPGNPAARLHAGANDVRFAGASAHVEPDSVVLRDPTGKHAFQILEQNYRSDSISQGLLLSLFEGKTIEFEVRLNDGSVRTVNGKVIRSGYVLHYAAYQRYGAQYQYSQNVSGMEQPVIEVDGKLQFSLPGQPIFPTLGDDTILKPTLDWIIHSGERTKFDAELSYVSGGMSWSADYNAVAPENGDTLDLAGWVTLDNQSGKQFDHAHIKLMAGTSTRSAHSRLHTP